MSSTTPDPALVERCDNWGDVVRWRRLPGHAVSVEGWFRAPRGAEVDWETLAPPRNRPKFDLHDAQRVEDGVCTLPLYPHALLRLWHVHRWDPGACLRVAAKAAGERRGTIRGFDASLDLAYKLLAAALLLPDVIRKQRARAIVNHAILGAIDAVD